MVSRCERTGVYPRAFTHGRRIEVNEPEQLLMPIRFE